MYFNFYKTIRTLVKKYNVLNDDMAYKIVLNCLIVLDYFDGMLLA